MHEAAFRALVLIEYDIMDSHSDFRGIVDNKTYDMDRNMGRRVRAYSGAKVDAPVVANFEGIYSGEDRLTQ